MPRLLFALIGLVLCAGLVLAEDYQGIVKELAKEKNTITLTVDNQTMTLEFSKDPLLLNDKGKALPGGLTAIKPGWEVKVFTDKKGDKDIITTLKVIEMKTAAKETKPGKGESIQGIVKDISKDKTKITLTVDNQSKTLDLSKDAKIVNDKDKALAGGLGAIKTGWEVKVVTDKKGDKDVITSVKVIDMKAKK